MAIRTGFQHGQFAWLDLTARDMGAARQYYHKLFGWESIDFDTQGGPPYALFQLAGHTIAGIGQMTETLLAKNLRACWNSYIAVDEIESVCRRAEELGGSVTVPVTDVGEAGRLAFLRDPTGAQVGLWQRGAFFGAEVTQDYHCLCWNELLTRDIQAARSFYEQLFGWEFTDYPSAWSKYYLVQQGEEENSGMLQMDERWGDMPACWLPYFAVRSVDLSVDRARQLGGFVHVHPYDIPEGRFAMVGDAQGGVFDLVEMTPTAEESQ